MKLSRINFPSFKHFPLITSTICLLSLTQFCLALPQYINEFHYDNTGADQFEYVEIAGVAGTDLSGWRLDFYNGTNGTIYSSWALSGLVDDEVAGFGALSFSGSTGIQNGPNDGIALVNNLGALIQFISYEGVLTGTEGAALGITSQDVGLVQGGNVPLGSSLQLTGWGNDSDDFTWTSDQSSFGNINVGQSYSQISPSVPVQNVDEPGQLGLMCFALLSLFASRRISSRLSTRKTCLIERRV